MATEFHIERDNNTIFIGENTSMHGRGTKTVHFALDEGTNVVVGEDCMFSMIFRFVRQIHTVFLIWGGQTPESSR